MAAAVGLERIRAKCSHFAQWLGRMEALLPLGPHWLMTIVTESLVEDAALDWYRGLGYQVLSGYRRCPLAGLVSGGATRDVVLRWQLQGALERSNPSIPQDALHDAARRLLRPSGATLEDRNRSFHRMLVDGVTVEYRDEAGDVRGAQVRVLGLRRTRGETTGSRSTSSPFRRTSTRAARISSSSSTVCRSRSSN